MADLIRIASDRPLPLRMFCSFSEDEDDSWLVVSLAVVSCPGGAAAAAVASTDCDDNRFDV